ncbi:LysE family translocator [Pseudomonas amygdali]|uniref:LysE family translocator n=1 Tax=Pseudomonas amygdali TaxID=47877 RepID=UPI0005C7F1E5|nr:LysE family translocator [Pseudomonas amygdali]
MDLQLLVLFIVAFTSAVAVPGPNVAFAVAQALKYGTKTVVPCSFGFGLATAIHAVVALSGVGLIIRDHPWVLNYLRWLGAIYLTYLAISTFFAKPSPSETNVIVSSPRQMFIDSLLVALTNPKGWLATLLTYPAFISPHVSYIHQAMTLSLVGMIISLMIYGGYMFLAQKARAAFNNESIINRITGVIYASVALCLVMLS